MRPAHPAPLQRRLCKDGAQDPATAERVTVGYLELAGQVRTKVEQDCR